jgi:hypothetical protein
MLRRIVFALVSALASLVLFVTAASAESCPNAAIRQQQGSAYLPDCRAYEQVTPTTKAGYVVGNNLEPIPSLAVDPAGDRVTYAGVNPLPGASSGSTAAFLGERDSDGWHSTSLLPVPGPNQPGLGLPEYDGMLRGSTPDQRVSVYYDGTTEPFGSIWIVRADGTRQRIADASAPIFGGIWAAHNPFLEGISDDGRHVVFGDTDALIPGAAPTGSEILYEWVDDGSGGGVGTLRVVNRTSEPAVALLSSAGAGLGGGPLGGGVRENGIDAIRHAISADGSRIFFQNPASEEGLGELPAGGGPLYLRENGATTLTVSEAAPGYVPINPPTKVQYLDASTDGSLVFFWANGDLVTGADPAGGIYRFEADTGTLTFLATAPELESRPPSAIASSDGSHLYYQRAEDVYLNVAGQNRLVLAGAKVAEFNKEHISDGYLPTANVSPTGRFFAFTANSQVYLYDADRQLLQEISTSPTGPPPSTYESSTVSKGATSPRFLTQRFMSDDGSFVFFTTNAALVPSDSDNAPDVYEWHNGQVSLLSSGTSASNGTSFAGTDSTGANAFFATDDKLVPEDRDSISDIYDARIDGGFEALVAPSCIGESCQGQPDSPPMFPSAGSISIQLSGNVLGGQPPAEKVTVTGKRAVIGRRASFRVTVPAAGRLAVSGRGLLTTSKTLGTASTVTVPMSLTPTSVHALQKRHALTVPIKIAFRPPGGSVSTVALTVTFKASPSKKRKGR